MCGLNSGGFAQGVWKREVTLTFQKCIIIAAKRQQTGSVKVNIDLCWGKIVA